MSARIAAISSSAILKTTINQKWNAIPSGSTIANSGSPSASVVKAASYSTMMLSKNAPIQTANAVPAVAKTFARHQTIHPSLKRQIDTLRGVPGVDRVILGPSRGCRHNRPVGTLKIQTTVPTGIRMLGYSDRGVSEFYVITSNSDGTRCEIVKRFELDET